MRALATLLRSRKDSRYSTETAGNSRRSSLRIRALSFDGSASEGGDGERESETGPFSITIGSEEARSFNDEEECKKKEN